MIDDFNPILPVTDSFSVGLSVGAVSRAGLKRSKETIAPGLDMAE